jgi:hypothetical protein
MGPKLLNTSSVAARRDKIFTIRILAGVMKRITGGKLKIHCAYRRFQQHLNSSEEYRKRRTAIQFKMMEIPLY